MPSGPQAARTARPWRARPRRASQPLEVRRADVGDDADVRARRSPPGTRSRRARASPSPAPRTPRRRLADRIVSGRPTSVLRLPGVRSTGAQRAQRRRAQLLGGGLAVRPGDADDPAAELARARRAPGRPAPARGSSTAMTATPSQPARHPARARDHDRRPRRAAAACARRSRSRRRARPAARRTAGPARDRAAVVAAPAKRRARASPAACTVPPIARAAKSSGRRAGVAVGSSSPLPSCGGRQRRRRLLAIVEVKLGRAEDLVVLVALAGDQHDVARRAAAAARRGSRRAGRPRRGSRASAARQLAASQLGRARAGAPRRGSCRRSPRILGARVVAGDDRQVGVARRDLAHHRALVAIAIAAAAEHARSAARAVSGRTAAMRALQRVGRVRVVDEHSTPRVVRDALEPPGHAATSASAARRSPRRGSPRAIAMPTASARFATL